VDNDGDIRVPCNKCNGALHHLFLEDVDGNVLENVDEAGVMGMPPRWICQDEMKVMKKGDVIKIVYLDGTIALLEFKGM